jgi:hypothetical protein
MKTNLFNFMIILAIPILVVCVFVFTACNEKDEPEEEENPYETPSGFDTRKDGDVYGTLTEKSYYSSKTGATRKCYVIRLRTIQLHKEDFLKYLYIYIKGEIV